MFLGSRRIKRRKVHEKCFICDNLSALSFREAGTSEVQRTSSNRDNTVTYSVVQKHQVVRGQGYEK